MDIFNLWSVIFIAVAGHYFLEYKKMEQKNIKDLEKRIEKLEKTEKG